MAMALCLFPIWYSTFLPMQDYPLHLFQANVLATFSEPLFNWSENYIRNPQLTPYSSLHHLIALISQYTGIHTAGKLIITLYVSLITYISLRSTTNNKDGSVSLWPGILLFPLIFNQAYYLGFANYLISIPVLVIALQQHRSRSQSQPGNPLLVTHVATLVLLFLIHPYAFAVFAVSSLLIQVKHQLLQSDNHAFTLVPVLSLLILTAWLLSNTSPDNITHAQSNSLVWLNPGYTALFHLVLFTNHAAANILVFIPVILWVTIVVTIILTIKTHIRQLARSDFFLLFIATSIGLFTLPFAVGDYHYFNLRLVPVSLVFLVLALRGLEFSRQQKITLSLCSLLLILHSTHAHIEISKEKEEILPVLAVMKPNSSLLPLYLEGGSKQLNRAVYYQFSEHDHNYYHLYVGGGVSPNILPNQMFPVLDRTKKGANHTRLSNDKHWLKVAPDYDYLLIRHGGKHSTPELPTQFESLIRNGTWELFVNITNNE
jgi:hypothetical protein